MSSDTSSSGRSNADVVRAYFEACYSGDEAALGRTLAAGFVAHVPGGRDVGASEWTAIARMLHEAVPDLSARIEDLVAAGDRVVIRYTSGGTHKGDLFGAPGTGREVTMPGIEVLRLDGGLVAECWGQYDMTAVFGGPC